MSPNNCIQRIHKLLIVINETGMWKSEKEKTDKHGKVVSHIFQMHNALLKENLQIFLGAHNNHFHKVK